MYSLVFLSDHYSFTDEASLSETAFLLSIKSRPVFHILYFPIGTQAANVFNIFFMESWSKVVEEKTQHDKGPVVQSILSLTRSLRDKLVKYMPTI